MKRSVILLYMVAITIVTHAQDSTKLRISDLKLYPVLWMQTSAEYRALCYQAFNTAKAQLDAIPKRKFRKQKLAIVTDIDETFLDNSYFEVQQMLAGKRIKCKSIGD